MVRTRHAPVGVAILVASATLAACSHYPRAEGDRLQAELYALQTRMEAVDQQLAELSEAQARQAEQLSGIAALVGDLNLDARRNDADFGVQIEDLLQEIARLKGTAVTLDTRLSNLESQTSKAQEEFDLKLETLKEDEGSAQAAAAEQERLEALLGEPPKALDEAQRLSERGAPKEARRLLRELTLRNEKKRSFRKYEARAQYLVAETYFAEGNYQQAAAEYNKVRKSYGRSSFVPDAYLKLGMCFERLELPADARLFYETLVQQYGKSPAARTARKRLRDLK